MKELDLSRTIISHLSIIYVLILTVTDGDPVEYMENTHAVVINNTTQNELYELKRLIGTPIGDARIVPKVHPGVQSYTNGKINCHRIPEGTSQQRKDFLLKMCPELRKNEFKIHAEKVTDILSSQHYTNKSLDEQKKEFYAEVLGMAKSAGHLPTLQLAKKKRK